MESLNINTELLNYEEDNYDTMCPICMENITVLNKTTTSCGHVFHSSCIFKNLMLRSSCPMCRVDLISKNDLNSISRIASNSNINININYNISNPPYRHQSLTQEEVYPDVDEDIINALLDVDGRNEYYGNSSFEDYLHEQETQIEGESTPQVDPYRSLSESYNFDLSSDDDAENTESDDDDDAENTESDEELEEGEILEDTDNSSLNDNIELSDIYRLHNNEDDVEDDVEDDEDDVEDDEDDDECIETDVSLEEVKNKMFELGYTSEDMLYFMTWRVNPFYFNRQYIEKYTPEFYDNMVNNLRKILRREILNHTLMTVDELN
jgi:hypothetical protein